MREVMPGARDAAHWRVDCGSTFTNPPGDHAARLIEAAGLKGFRIGDIMVSPKHANFLVNTGAATAADVLRLVAHVQETVQRQFNVALTPEFHTVGQSAGEPN